MTKTDIGLRQCRAQYQYTMTLYACTAQLMDQISTFRPAIWLITAQGKLPELVFQQFDIATIAAELLSHISIQAYQQRRSKGPQATAATT